MKKVRNTLAVACVLVFAASFAFASGQAQSGAQSGAQSNGLPTVHWKLATAFTTGSIESDAYVKLINYVSSHTNGKFKIKYYPNGLLANDHEIMQDLKLGTLDIGNAPTSKFANTVPALNIYTLPFLFKNFAAIHGVLDGPIGQQIDTKLLKKMGIRTIANYDAGFRDIATKNRTIHNLSQLHGLKIRVISNPLNVAMGRALGYNAVPLPWHEVYTALQEGTIDGSGMPLPNMYSFKEYEVAHNLYAYNIYNAVQVVGVSNAHFEKLPAAYQKVLLQAAKVSQTYERQQLVKEDAFYRKFFKEHGVTITYPTAAQFKELRKLEAPVLNKWKTTVGVDLFNEVVNALQQ